MESVLLELCLVCLVSSYKPPGVVNVALHKLANQSSSHTAFKHPGSAAVDGKKIPDKGQNSELEICIHTSENPKDKHPWWEVDLGQTYPVLYITITARPNHLQRMQATTITLDNKECFTISKAPATSTFDVNCTHPLTGQKVRLTRNSGTNDISLNICEVEVWACNPGRYGGRCDHSCGQCRETICDQATGHCPKGCKPGWTDELCQKRCKDGKYGENCSQSCGHCYNETCNKETGRCPSGTCAPGWKGDFCRRGCDDGKYGWNCSQSCGYCYNNKTCNKETGRCPSGTCAPGWKGDFCEQLCNDGEYGGNCSQSCGNCYNGTCDKATGRCPRGACAPGWKGDSCQEKLIPEDTGVINAFIGVASTVIVIVLIIAAVIVLFLVNRRRSQQKPGHSASPAPPNTADECPTPEVHYVNTMARQPCPLPPSADEYATVKPRETRRPHVHQELNDKLPADRSLQASDIYVNFKTNSLLMKPRKTEEVLAVHLPKTEGGIQSQKGAEAGSQVKTSARLEPADRRSPELDERLYACVSKPVSPASRLPVRTLKMDIEKKLRLFATDEEFSNFLSGLLYDCKIGSRKENGNKNRFNNVIPYDSTRVILEKVLGNEVSDYINASFIRGYKRDKAYIAAQGPKDNTADDFWRMVWQENVIQIIMLTNLVEIGKSKCFEYWPSKGENLGYGPIEVKCFHEEHRAHFIVRSFHLRPRNVTKFRQVDQLQFTSWMDHEIPSDAGLIDFWKYAKSHPSACSSSPPVVHCSAGIGRTGTYIALDIVMEQAKQEGNIDIQGVVTRLREDRCSMVQNKEQYSFLHQAVLEAYSGLNSQLSLDQFDATFSNSFRRTSAKATIDLEFENLQLMKDRLPEPGYTIATLPENRYKNRNMNALPPDSHLAYLTTHVKGRNNYISAVFAPTLHNARGSILTQLPLADTMQDLWRLVESFGVITIVSLGRVDWFEKDSSTYWPMADRETMETGSYTLTLLTKTVLGRTLQSYTVKWERKRALGEVRLLQYSDWQGEFPSNSDDLVCLLQMMQGVLHDHKQNPFIIQCIDGAARSGWFCALCNVVSQMTCDRVVDIYTKVREVQRIRPQVVTSLEQYRFCYEVVQRLRNKQCTHVNR